MLPLGAVVAGLLAETMGVHTTLLVAAAGMALGVVWLLLSPIRTLRKLPDLGEATRVV